MLTWNNFNTFKRCITSMTPLILDERVEEVIILDNGSHEIELQDLLHSTESNYNKIRIIYSSENLGIAKGRKYLYDLCKGEYILSFDSDVVIIDSKVFISNFLKAINLKDMWLIGGGGGNHIFFPTVFRSDINNLPSPKEINQVTLVDEVAGWFHGFRSKSLKKNGGPLYMDERFTPFWGEDSDFCYQIKLLGGKCCILGTGNLAHAWSSCDKKENHTNIEVMWKKMTDKWYPNFGNLYGLDFDETFYRENYIQYKDIYDIKEKYLLEGMRYGHVISRKIIKELFEVEFKSNIELIYNKEKYHTRDFIDNFFNRDNIVKNNYEVIVDNLKESENVFFIYFNSSDEIENYLTKELIKVRNSAVIIIVNKDNYDRNCEKILDSNWYDNYYLAKFTNYHDHMIPFIIAMQETKNHKFKKVIKLTPEMKITNDIKFEKIKDNAFTVDMVMDYFHYRSKDYYFPKGMLIDHDNLIKILNSFPLKSLLEIALKLPTEYSYNISPRFCPRLALDKLINQMENYEYKNKALVLYLTKIEDSEMVSNNCKKLKASGNCDILILNIGTEKFWSTKELGFDYYYVIGENEFEFFNYFSVLNILHLLDYSNIILMADNFVIEDTIEEFFNHSYYHNMSFLKTGEEFSINLCSILSEELMRFAGMIQEIKKASEEKKEINIMKTIDINIQRALGLRYLWKETKEETDNEISIEYTKLNDKFNPDDDFVLNFI